MFACTRVQTRTWSSGARREGENWNFEEFSPEFYTQQTKRYTLGLSQQKVAIYSRDFIKWQ